MTRERLCTHDFLWDGPGDQPRDRAGRSIPARYVGWSAGGDLSRPVNLNLTDPAPPTSPVDGEVRWEWEAWMPLENGVMAVLFVDMEGEARLLPWEWSEAAGLGRVLHEGPVELVAPVECLGFECPRCWHDINTPVEDPGDVEELMAVLRRWSEKAVVVR